MHSQSKNNGTYVKWAISRSFLVECLWLEYSIEPNSCVSECTAGTWVVDKCEVIHLLATCSCPAWNLLIEQHCGRRCGDVQLLCIMWDRYVDENDVSTGIWIKHVCPPPLLYWVRWLYYCKYTSIPWLLEQMEWVAIVERCSGLCWEFGSVVYSLSDTNPFLLEIVESEILGEGSGALLCIGWYYLANVQFRQLNENQGTEEAPLCGLWFHRNSEGSDTLTFSCLWVCINTSASCSRDIPVRGLLSIFLLLHFSLRIFLVINTLVVCAPHPKCWFRSQQNGSSMSYSMSLGRSSRQASLTSVYWAMCTFHSPSVG
jgi:hypothetical protein